jgi:DNA-binding NarL/FixJ family response regulator
MKNSHPREFKTKGKMIKVVIADDHNLVSKLIYQMLKPSREIKVVGLASDGNELIEILDKTAVDVVLLDIDMPNLDGMQALVRIAKKYPSIKIIMLSNHSEAWIIQKSLKSGAAGYLTKFAESNEVVEAIVKVYQGGNYFCKLSFKNLMNKIANKDNHSPTDVHYDSLTDREREVLQLIVKEMTTREISAKLNISIRTVETHRKNILKKLGAKNTVGLIKTAMEAKLVETY